MTNLEQILQENTQGFLEFIKRYADGFRDQQTTRRFGGFPLFIEGNSAFYNQVKLDETIENFIWRYLVDGVFRKLFCEEKCKEQNIECEWVIQPHLAYSYVDSFEQNMPIEFIISHNGKRTGYRYTNMYARGAQAEKIFTNHRLDELVILNFSSSDISTFVHEFPTILSKECLAKTRVVTLKDFFTQYFTLEEYEYYLKNVKETVGEAYRYCGLQTVPNLTRQFLPYFISDMTDEIQGSNLPYEYYTVIKDMADLYPWQQTALNNPRNVISANDKAIIQNNFINKKRYLALCGSKDFANSFITSEYLYKTLLANNSFDYTSVVCGYLKSVEQFLYCIVKDLLNRNNNPTLWIKSRKKSNDLPQNVLYRNINGQTHVEFVPANDEYFDTAFTPLINLIKSNSALWAVSPGATACITTLLAVFCDECRNEHFHKDNISDKKEVETIRKNTKILFCWLLGGLKLYANENSNQVLLGILDSSFGDMYRAIRRIAGSCGYFELTDSNGQTLLAAMPMKQEEPQINEYGQIHDTKIRMIRIHRASVDGWENDNWKSIEDDYSSEDVFYLTPDSMPRSLTYLNKMNGQKKQVVW